MDKRLELMRFMIKKHVSGYHDHIVDALLGIETIADARLHSWENEVTHAISNHQEIRRASKEFLKSSTYGDGGMASAVRIVSFGDENE